MSKTIFVTGGAGFIGTNVCAYHLKKGDRVVAFDNLSRKGSYQNLAWLKAQGGNFEFTPGDVRNAVKTEQAVREIRPDILYHFAAQTTMVTSVTNPREDFEINTLGTFNVLETVRKHSPSSIFLFTSTNKVYGELADIKVIEEERRYRYKDIDGIDESQPLDFHGPYGCSKGAADQYVIDYARIYGLKTVVFRQSTMYGVHQFGIEEQGWIAWFISSLLYDKPVTIFGDGKQVRDILFCEDFLLAYEGAVNHIDQTKGNAYNLGGGKDFSISILELFDIIQEISGKKFSYSFDKWRPGDQKVYISKIDRAKKDFHWAPKVSPKEGVKKIYEWILTNKELMRESNII